MMKILPCAALFLPLFVLTADPLAADTGDDDVVIIDPMVIAEVVDFLQWRDVTLVYDSSLSLKDKHDLLAMFVDLHMAMITIEFPVLFTGTMSSAVSAIQKTGISTILLYARPDTASLFLQQAKEAGILEHKYQWVMTGTERQLTFLEDLLCCLPSNMLLVAPASHPAEMPSLVRQLGLANTSGGNNSNNSEPLGEGPEEELQQDSFTIYSYNLHSTRFDVVASRSVTTSGLVLLHRILYPNIFSHFQSAKLRVGAVQAEPFLSRIDNGTVHYIGFCITLLEELSKGLNFTSYEIIEPPDRVYGSSDENGTWNGMIGMLIRGQLDLAVGPITITPERESVVDFTVPIMEDGGGILTKREKATPDLMNVFRPFSLPAWLLIVACVLVTSVLLYVINKFTRPIFPSSSALRSTRQPWTFEECWWAIYGSITNQGVNRHPETASGRMVLGCWWVVAILILSMYTASLAALLTVRDPGQVIDSIHDLAASSLDPVLLAGSNWWSLFKRAESGVYATVGSRMFDQPQILVNDQAMQLVYAGTGALVHDVNQVLYLYGLDCKNLYMASHIFNANGLGFAMPKNAPYRKSMNKIILKLQEGGFVEAWRSYFWKSAPECFSLSTSSSSQAKISQAEQLHVFSVVGVLVVYASMIGVALITHLLQLTLPRLSCWQGFRRGLKNRLPSFAWGGESH